MDEAEFKRLANSLRAGVQQADPPRPIDQVLLMREDPTANFEELVALDPIRVLLSHPKWRRVLGFGWFEFKLFLWLIILWNILTFYGHWHHELINPKQYITTDGRITGFIISGPLDALFYFSRLDHLILLPAFLCLMAALIKWREQE